VSENDIGLGTRLSEGRKAAGRSQEDIARDLLLDVHIIRALESEDFDALPEPTYVRGYIRSYARLLSLDPEELLEIYARLGHDEPEWEINEPARHEVAQGRKFRLVTAIVFVAIVGLLVTWLMTEGNGHKEEAEDTVASHEAVVPEMPHVQAPLVEELESEPVGAETVPQPEDQEAVSEAGPEAPVQDEPPAQEPEGGPDSVNEVAGVAEDESLGNFSLAGVDAEGQDRIVLTFTADSWVEIVDANDVQVLRGLFKKGVVRELVGSAPFSVFLGNTQGVAIKINGESFDPSPYTRRDSTSRFTLKAP